MRLVLKVMFLAVWMLTLSAPVHAFEPRAGDTVVVSAPIRDDLYAAGGSVEVPASVDGDLVAAGGTVALTGPVSGGVLAAGGTVRITGTVGRSVRAAAGTLTVDGRIGSDAVLAGGTVLVGQQARVARDLVAAGGSVDVRGTVGRNTFLSGGSVVIGGAVQGNVEVQADRLVLLPTARIAGRLQYSASTPADIQSGAQVSGGVQRLPASTRRAFRRGPLAFGIAGRIAEFLWLLVVGFVLLALMPVAVRRVSDRVGSQFWQSLLTGFVLLVVAPVAAVVLLITVLGIPLAALAMVLYAATLYLGQVAVAGWTGDRITRSMKRNGAVSPYLAFTIGAFVLLVLFALPFVGWVARIMAVLVGFGALWAAVWGMRRPPARAAMS